MPRTPPSRRAVLIFAASSEPDAWQYDHGVSRPEHAATGGAPSLWRVGRSVTLVVVLATIPVVFIISIAGENFAFAAVAGAVIGILGVAMLHSLRNGLIAVGVMAVTATVSVLVSPWPLAGAIWLGLCGIGVGLSGLRGWSMLASTIALWCAFLVVTPTQIGSVAMFEGAEVEFSLRASWSTALAVIVCGCFTALVTPLLLRGRPQPSPRPPIRPQAAYWMAGGIGMLLFLEAWISLSEYRVPAVHWLMLTTLMIVQPSTASTIRRSAHRALGTVAGAGIAVAIVVAGTPLGLRMAIGYVLLIMAFTVMLSGGPYWMFATFLTPAVILLTEGTANGLDVTAARLIFTLIGVLLAFGLVLIVWAVQHGRRGVSAAPA